MARVLIAAIIALLVSVLLGPKFIAFMRRNEFGQHVRPEGVPPQHAEKQGTPTMGGLLIVVAAAIAFLALSRYTVAGLTVFGVTVGCAAVGFLDDFTKIRHRRSLGLPGRWKLLLLAGVAFGVGVVIDRYELGTQIVVPPVTIDLSWGWYALAFVVIAGATNGVNLTDGIDGLAAGTGLIALVTFTAMNILTYIRSGQPSGFFHGQDIGALDQAILGGAVIGGCIGFLWYNAFPAEVFMGDTGAMAIGGALAGFAIMSNTELLLVLVGGIFVIEAVSVMLQVLSFKYWGRRVLLMAPLHHHFEMKAWSQTKIMVRFWIVGAILGGLAFAVYYNYFFDFIDVRT